MQKETLPGNICLSSSSQNNEKKILINNLKRPFGICIIPTFKRKQDLLHTTELVHKNEQSMLYNSPHQQIS